MRSLESCTLTQLGVLFFLSLTSPHAFAQTSRTVQESASEIQDNSFLVEEAFNQEEQVVQHILNGLYFRRPRETTLATFTQEWPLFGQRHQFSYSFAYSVQSPAHGFGDTFLNYRYSIFEPGASIACAPRLSAILPTGDQDKGLGNGVVGWQLNLPVSFKLTDDFITHWNVGGTVFPGVSGLDASRRSVRRSLLWYNVGASAIWLAHSTFSLMIEAVLTHTTDLDEQAALVHSTEFILGPGVRWAINLDGLQIVPGIAVPIRRGEQETTVGLFLYLSFEHPF